MPSLENTSASKLSVTSPLMRCTRGMPAAQASAACWALERWSAGMLSAFSVNNASSLGPIIWRMIWPSVLRPSSVDMKSSLVAFNSLATASATASLFNLNVLPSPSKPKGGMTGVMPCASRDCKNSASTRSTLPVCKWSVPSRMPSGWATTALALAARRSLVAKPSRISCVRPLVAVRASLSVAPSVTPVLSKLFGVADCSSASAAICCAAPCTSTTRMLRDRSTAMSSRRLAKFTCVTTAPSAAMTNVLSRKRGMYCRIPLRSVGFTGTIFAGDYPEKGPRVQRKSASAARQRPFSSGVPMEKRIQSGNP